MQHQCLNSHMGETQSGNQACLEWNVLVGKTFIYIRLTHGPENDLSGKTKGTHTHVISSNVMSCRNWSFPKWTGWVWFGLGTMWDNGAVGPHFMSCNYPASSPPPLPLPSPTSLSAQPYSHRITRSKGHSVSRFHNLPIVLSMVDIRQWAGQSILGVQCAVCTVQCSCGFPLLCTVYVQCICKYTIK